MRDLLREQFTEIMVDEYQDTNEVQNVLFDALSRDGKNLFLVGDVKQSIYRFRLADPTIFLGKYESWPPAERAEDGQPRKLILSRNFRSRPQVLYAVNYVFANIMSRACGEMEYGAAEALVPGGSFEEAWDARVLGQAIDAFLATLSRENRVIFLRRYWFGDAVKDIARHFGMTENAVSVRLSRLRASLKDYLIKEECFYEA